MSLVLELWGIHLIQHSLVSLTGGSCTWSGDIYSIGEEQGPGYVKAIEWSPLGISHRREYGLLLQPDHEQGSSTNSCMLAILTTTHRLKISEFSGHQTSEWRDVFDIGQLIQDYGGWETVDPDRHIQRLRSRSRCS